MSNYFSFISVYVRSIGISHDKWISIELLIKNYPNIITLNHNIHKKMDAFFIININKCPDALNFNAITITRIVFRIYWFIIVFKINKTHSILCCTQDGSNELYKCRAAVHASTSCVGAFSPIKIDRKCRLIRTVIR